MKTLLVIFSIASSLTAFSWTGFNQPTKQAEIKLESAQIDALMSDASDKPACIKKGQKALIANKKFNALGLTKKDCAFKPAVNKGVVAIRFEHLSDAQKAKLN